MRLVIVSQSRLNQLNQQNNPMSINYSDLVIYRKSINLIQNIYTLIKSNSLLQKDYSLSDQLKRASISVSANISEGYFRSKKQTQNYLEIASGSTNEVVTLLIIIEKIYGINTLDLQKEYVILGKQINAFSKTFR